MEGAVNAVAHPQPVLLRLEMDVRSPRLYPLSYNER